MFFPQDARIVLVGVPINISQSREQLLEAITKDLGFPTKLWDVVVFVNERHDRVRVEIIDPLGSSGFYRSFRSAKFLPVWQKSKEKVVILSHEELRSFLCLDFGANNLCPPL